jgi:hypothetical protein
LNKTLKTIDLAALSSPIDGLNRKLDGIQKQLQIGPALDAHLQHIVSPHSAASKFIGCKDCQEGLNSFNVFLPDTREISGILGHQCGPEPHGFRRNAVGTGVEFGDHHGDQNSALEDPSIFA